MENEHTREDGSAGKSGTRAGGGCDDEGNAGKSSTTYKPEKKPQAGERESDALIPFFFGGGYMYMCMRVHSLYLLLSGFT